jgi:D-isomer specific 2-hydroxyacid dehydrogenase, NAD binding domain
MHDEHSSSTAEAGGRVRRGLCHPPRRRAIGGGRAGALGGLEIVDEMLRRSDYLVISLPVTPETWGLIGEKQLHSMKPTAMLVNVSRAEIIDEEALYRALAERTIAGPPWTSGIVIRPPLDQHYLRASRSTSWPTSS